MASAHSKSHVFPVKIQSKTHAFSDASFKRSFFEVLVRLDAKTLDFGTPLAPSGVQNGAQNRPSGTQKPPKKNKMVQYKSVLEPTCSQGRFRSAPGHRFGGFGMDFE